MSDTTDAVRARLHRALLECSGVIADTFAERDADTCGPELHAIVNQTLIASEALIRALTLAAPPGELDVFVDCRPGQKP